MTASSWQRATILMEVLHVSAQMDMEEMAEQLEEGVQVLALVSITWYGSYHAGNCVEVLS